MHVSISIIGALALIGGSVGFFALPYGLSTGIRALMNLGEKGLIFPKYMAPATGVDTIYHLYAITNPRDVLSGGKPSFAVKGPYRFESTVLKDNIRFSERGEKLSYEISRKVVPSEINSADLDEEMWLVNPVMLTVAQITRRAIVDRMPFKSLAERFVMNGLQMALDGFNEQLLVLTTPRQMLVGRRIRIFETLSSFGAFGYNVGAYLPGKLFGIVSGGNETVEIWTGIGNTRSKFADVSKYKNQDRMTAWTENRCNEIEGTNGELYKPFPKKGEPIKIFMGLMCRSVSLDPLSEEPRKTASGAMALDYEVSQRLFQGAQSNPENQCFCEDPRTYDCQYDGLITMGPCLLGAPLYLTRGNFKGVDKRIRDLVNWKSMLFKNDTKAGTLLQMPDNLLIRLDPITGIPLEIDMTFLSLFKVVRNNKFKSLANVQPITYMPLFSVTLKFKAPSELASPLIVLQKIEEYHGLAMGGAVVTGLGALLLGSMFS